MMETRFPISKDRSHVHIAFKWFDAFRATRALEQSSIHFEKAAILFNLGAVLTQQALGCDLSSDSGVKEAAKKFQVILLLHRQFDKLSRLVPCGVLIMGVPAAAIICTKVELSRFVSNCLQASLSTGRAHILQAPGMQSL